MASMECLLWINICILFSFLSSISGFYSRSSQPGYSIQKCKTSFMCPPFCMKSRDGCYVCDCGEKMVNQMKNMINDMKNDYKPLFQMGSEMTLNGGKTGSSIHYGSVGTYGGMMIPQLSPYNNIRQFNGMRGQFGGMGGQTKQPNYMISNYLEPDFKEFYRPFHGIIPGKCSLMDFSCRPDCWRTDVYTGCFKCQCKTESIVNKQSSTPPSTSKSTGTVVTELTAIISSISPDLTTDKSTTKTTTTTQDTATTQNTTTSMGTTLINTITSSTTTSSTKSLRTTPTMKKTSSEYVIQQSTSTPSTTTTQLSETIVTGTKTIRPSKETETTRPNQETETKLFTWTTNNSEATATSTLTPTNDTAVMMPSPDVMLAPSNGSSKTICPPVTDHCPEECLLIDPLTYCSVCFCINIPPDITTTKMTTRSSTAERGIQMKRYTTEQVCKGLSPLCPGKCVTLDKNWCAKCSCPLETPTTVSVNRLKAIAKDETDFVTSQPNENVSIEENSKGTTCKSVPENCPEYCLVLNDDWCPVCIC